MFSVGDKISHPIHGAGIVTDIVDRQVAGETTPFYSVSFTCGSITDLIPCASCEKIGVRNIVSSDEAENVIKKIPSLTHEFNDNWSKRHRENMDKIKSGDLYEVAVVVKSLVLRDRIKALSTSERKTLSTAKNILISELALATGKDICDIESDILQSIEL